MKGAGALAEPRRRKHRNEVRSVVRGTESLVILKISDFQRQRVAGGERAEGFNTCCAVAGAVTVAVTPLSPSERAEEFNTCGRSRRVCSVSGTPGKHDECLAVLDSVWRHFTPSVEANHITSVQPVCLVVEVHIEHASPDREHNLPVGVGVRVDALARIEREADDSRFAGVERPGVLCRRQGIE